MDERRSAARSALDFRRAEAGAALHAVAEAVLGLVRACACAGDRPRRLRPRRRLPPRLSTPPANGPPPPVALRPPRTRLRAGRRARRGRRSCSSPSAPPSPGRRVDARPAQRRAPGRRRDAGRGSSSAASSRRSSLYLGGLWLLRARPPRLAVVAVARRRDPARAARRAAPALDRRVDVLGLRADRRGAPREPVRRRRRARSRAIRRSRTSAPAGGTRRPSTAPLFTLASEPVALAAGSSADAAAWIYKALGALAVLASRPWRVRARPRQAFAFAFVGWNPLLAVHFAGGGHNDAWMSALVLAALVLAARGRLQAAGRRLGGGDLRQVGAAALPAAARARGAGDRPPRRAPRLRDRGGRRRRRSRRGATAPAGSTSSGRWRGTRTGRRGSRSRTVWQQLGIPHAVAVGAVVGLFALAYLWLLPRGVARPCPARPRGRARCCSRRRTWRPGTSSGRRRSPRPRRTGRRRCSCSRSRATSLRQTVPL